MKFKFPLQKVLEHRKIRESLVQKDFQDAMFFYNQEQQKLDQMLEQQKNAHLQAGTFSAQGGAMGPALSQIHEFLKGQEVRIQRQQERLQEIEKLVEAKRDILRQAAQEYKIMMRMREKQFEDYKMERTSQDQKDMDEQSILRFKAVKES